MNYDIIIIGAGPAGLSAAIYASRANKSVLVLEAVAPGGQVLQTENIDNYPGLPNIKGKDLAKNFLDQAKSLGAEFRTEKAVKIHRTRAKILKSKTFGTKHFNLNIAELSEEGVYRFEVTTDLKNTYHAEAIILATGTTFRKLHLEGEDELIGKGISFCATCDGALYKNKPVAVYGGGNSALYSALYLSDLAEKVYVIHRRKQFRADSSLVEKAKSTPNIEFVLNTEISGFLKSGDTLSGLKLTSDSTLDVSALFVTIGREPADTELCENSDDINIDHDRDGYIEIDEDTLETDEQGIFAAGDCREKDFRQIVTAVSDGAIAAASAINLLNN